MHTSISKFSGLAALVAFGLTFALSPDLSAKTFAVGVKGGVDSSNFVGDDVPDPGDGASNAPKYGFNIGAQALLNFGMFGVQPEVAYTQKGHRVTFDDIDNDATTTHNYLEIPLLARLNLNLPAIPITPKLLAGPTFSYFLSGSTTNIEFPSGDTNKTDVDDEDVHDLDIGLAAGAGVDIGLGPGVLTFDLRFTRGFTEIPDTDADDTAIFNSMGSVNVGYGIGF